MKPKIAFTLITVGLLLIAVGILLPFIKGIDFTPFRYIYATGALLLLGGRIMLPYKGSNLRLKRLYRIESWSAIFFCVGAFFLFYPPGNNFRDTLAFTLAGAAIQIFTSIMIPRTAKKE